MDIITIYHNGICSKSKGTLELLQEKEIPLKVRWYLMEPFTKEELTALLAKLGMHANEIVRKNEQLYINEYEGKVFTGSEWVDILIQNPELIERPIVEKGNVAIIARPPERVFELVK